MEDKNKPKAPAKPKSILKVRTIASLMKLTEELAPKTGYPMLDSIIKGFIPGHLYTMTAETNSGKTQLAVNFAVNVARQHKKVAYIALEPDVQIITSILAVWNNTTYEKALDIGTKNPENIDIFLQEDIPDIETLKSTMKHLVATSANYDLVIIDHIGYFVNSENNTNQAQSNLLKELAILTKKSNTAILIIAHPRKIDGKVTMNDIAGSAAFKQDSTEVLLLQRDKKNPDDEYDTTLSDIAYLVVAKKKVSSNSQISYTKLVFSSDSPKVTEFIHEDNTKYVEGLFDNQKGS